MNNPFSEDPDDLWNEYHQKDTTWERRVAILIAIAKNAYFNNQPNLELKYLKEAVELAKSQNLVASMLDAATTYLGRAATIGKELTEPLAYMDEVLENYQGFHIDVDVIEALGPAYCAKARAMMVQKRFAEAVYNFGIVLEYAELISDLPERAFVHASLARCHVELDNLEQAQKNNDAARDIYLSNSQISLNFEVDRTQSLILMAQGEFGKAIKLLKEVRILEQRMNGRSDVETKFFLAKAYMGISKFDKAAELLERIWKNGIRPWKVSYVEMLEFGKVYVECLVLQENYEYAQRIADECEALANRIPGHISTIEEEKLAEINVLRENGRHDLAEIQTHEYLEQANKSGDIAAHWRASHQVVVSYWNTDNFEEIVRLWESEASPGLEYQDEVVLSVKNMVSHALNKVGRSEEALQLNDQVISDARLETQPMEKIYAHENRARILKVMKKTVEARKYKDLALAELLEAGDSERALKLIKLWQFPKRSNWENY